jgi:hypothetical protein
VSRSARVISFGSVAALVLIGAICAVTIGGGTGQILGFVLIAVGLVLATSLVFLEVGLSEDRERARMGKSRPSSRSETTRLNPRPTLKRSRGHRHRLR